VNQDTWELLGDLRNADRIRQGDHNDPHSVLGPHVAVVGGVPGVVVRAYHPHAVAMSCSVDGEDAKEMLPLGGGMFGVFLPGRTLPFRYQLVFHMPSGGAYERHDAYSFPPIVGEIDLYLFGEGTHRRIWEVMGAHPREIDGVKGTSFTVWAPNARRVSVIGDFDSWDGRVFPMRMWGNSGVWEVFIPGVGVGALYKYEIMTREGAVRTKTDPYAQAMELPPAGASCVTRPSHVWADEDWMVKRRQQDLTRSPMSIYELHLGSWARVPEEGNRSLSYREIAPKLAAHVKRLGFTHVELMPVAEHAYYASWGYQVTGYYAPTSRYGLPDDFRYFVDYMHQQGIGVIIDWVPAHFPRDDFALRRFDGSALYEHDDPRRGEHPDWGTLIFNYARPQVRNFLVGNALYWLKEYHIDGLRVDAVASMLYLDYSRRAGHWLPNRHGGVENLEAIAFIRALNQIVQEETAGAFTVAEESTAWFGVTKRPDEGGLGFTFKWNMGWMNDTLRYFAKDPVHRKYHQDELTFCMLYEYSERFINPVSHDEVVHGKGALIEKMCGDWWRRLANYRLFLAYQYTRPGKKLLFMGVEVAPHREWSHDSSIDWHLGEDQYRKELALFLAELGQMYHVCPAFWERDPDPEGFAWIDCSDKDNSVLAYVRHGRDGHAIVVLNMTPVPHDEYRIGAPMAGRYLERLNSDDRRFGGSDYPSRKIINTENVPMHRRAQSMVLTLPPLGALVLVPVPLALQVDLGTKTDTALSVALAPH
jgi:1,4-alpha-glucan branching enzyme